MVIERQGYHHGELRAALIEAADAIICEGGIEAFSLREAARRAQVSPAAPSHHFGNARGLLTEVALLAYARLGRCLAEGVPAGNERPAAALRRMAEAYVRFALAQPGHFRLMFRSDLVDRSDPRYAAASTAALTGLAQAVHQHLAGVATVTDASASSDAGALFIAWSTIHGLAHLALEDKARYLFDGRDPQRFVGEKLPALLRQHWPDHASSV